MNRTIILITLSCLLICVLPAALADTCASPRNICDAEYVGRAAQASTMLEMTYQGEYQALIQGAGKWPDRYPAALFRLSQQTTVSINEANILLANELSTETPTTLAPRDAVYLAWIIGAYAGNGINTTNHVRITSLLASYVNTPASTTFPDDGPFLHNVTISLYTQSNNQPLIELLKSKGTNGWSSEGDPAALANIVIGLSALYSQTTNQTVRTLAEMNLDLLFARFAAVDAGGAYGGSRFGDVPGTAYDPVDDPWYGWSFLVLNTSVGNYQRFTEPSVLLANYCTNDAVRTLIPSRTSVGNQESKTALPAGGQSYAIATPDYVLGSSVDVGTNFTPSEGFVTRASLRFADDPRSFVLLTTQTTNGTSNSTSSCPDAILDDGGRLYTDDHLVLGKLGGGPCQEPHAFVSSPGNGFDVSPGTNGVILLTHLNTVFALRFLSGQTMVATAVRYAPLAGTIPPVYGASNSSFQQGMVIFPSDATQGGVFALEEVPQDFINQVGDGDLEEAVATNTSLSVDSGNINYKSLRTDVTGKHINYSFVPGEVILKANTILTITNYSDHAVRQLAGSYQFISSPTPGRWLIQGLYGGNAPQTLLLDFTNGMKSATPTSTYGCTGTGGTSIPSAVPTTDDQRLAYLAASLIQNIGDDYTIDCGPASDVLPNDPPVDGLVLGACVLNHGGDRTVGLVYSNASGAGAQGVLAHVNNYYPFGSGTPAPDQTLCNAKLSDDTLNFEECGSSFSSGTSYGSLTAYVSPNAGLLVISSENPFSQGVLQGVIDFFRGLFGTVEQQGADPAATGAFSYAYFSRTNGKEVKAILANGHAELLFEKMAANVTSLQRMLGVNAGYQAGGTTQRLFADDVDPAAWRLVTAALRIIPAGTPKTFQGPCGTQLAECDPTVPGGVVRSCGDGTGNNVTCISVGQPDQCTLNLSACQPKCVDLDGDGYNQSAPGCGPPDCDDTNRSLALVFNNDVQIDCTTVTDCSVNNNSRCPQCIHPGATEYCDGVDNQYCTLDNIDVGCPNRTGFPPGNGGGSVCPSEQQNPSCPYICNSSTSPTTSTTCPTAWQAVATQGDYSFSIRINAAGWPEINITRLSSNLYKGFSCMLNTRTNLGAWGVVDNDTKNYVFLSQNPSNTQWTLYYMGGATGRLSSCWDVTASSGYNAFLNFSSFPVNMCSKADCTLSPNNCTARSICEALDPSNNLLHCIAYGGGGGGGGGGGCFTPDTPIMTPSGSHPISSLHVGDTVVSYDIATGNRLTSKITGTERVPVDEVLVINGRVRTTDVHPFFTRRGWVEGDQLVVGDEILTSDGSYEPVASLAYEPYHGLVYNIHVESSAHDFFAGGLLAHNKMQQYEYNQD